MSKWFKVGSGCVFATLSCEPAWFGLLVDGLKSMWSSFGPYCLLSGLNLLDNSLMGLDSPSTFSGKEQPKDGLLGFEDLLGSRCAGVTSSGGVLMVMLLCRCLYEELNFFGKVTVFHSVSGLAEVDGWLY